MSARSSWYFAAYAGLIGVAGPIAACTQSDTSAEVADQAAPQQQQEPAAPTTPSTQTPATQTGEFTDAQVRGYALAQAEIAPISARIDTMTAEQRAQATNQIQTILARNGISGDVYNAIAAQARTDQELRLRIAAQTPATYTDDQLRAFAAAAVEIEALNQRMANATPQQREEANAEIEQILARNSIDGVTYNAIAARAQVDQTLAQRIQTLYTAQRTGQSGDGVP